MFNGNLNFIIIALDDKAVEETYNRMIQIGFHNVLGYLKGGVDAWEKEIG